MCSLIFSSLYRNDLLKNTRIVKNMLLGMVADMVQSSSFYIQAKFYYKSEKKFHIQRKFYFIQRKFYFVQRDIFIFRDKLT